MPFTEDELRAVKSAVFNSGSNPGRLYIEFFAQVMDWPVDEYAPQTIEGPEKSVEHRVLWLKGDALGFASCTVRVDETTVGAWVRPLRSIVKAEIGGRVDRDPLTPAILRFLKLHFVDGEKLVLDLSTFSNPAQRDPAEAFLESTLKALSGAREQV